MSAVGGLAVIARVLLRRTVMMPMSGAVIVVVMSRPVSMNVNLAAVLVDADMVFGQAMRNRWITFANIPLRNS